MRVLITGANGLLGQKLVELYDVHREYDVLSTGRGPKRHSANIIYRPMDICSEPSITEIFDEFRPAAVIHTAAMTNVDQCELEQDACRNANVDAVAYLVSACQRHNSFLLQVSTDFIFSGEKGPLDELEKASPINYYGQTKLEAEKIIIESEISWAIARTVLVYGVVKDMSRSNIILWVKQSLENQKEIQVVNDQWRTPTLAEDLANGCFQILKRRANGIFNIAGKDLLTPYQMALQTADYFGLNKVLIKETDSGKFTQPARRPLRTGFVIEKAQKKLAYVPRSFREGIAMVAEQVKSFEQI